MEEQTFVRWVELPEAQPVRFDELPGLIAGALHEGPLAQAAAEINLEAELKALVDASELMVRDPLTLGPHTFPIGAALRRAVLLPREDLRTLLESRGIGLRLIRTDLPPDAPLWRAWLQLPTVKLWQAIALSIDREPTEPLCKAIFDGRVTDKRAPSHILELLKRWRYCEQALSFDGPIKPQGYGIANPPVCPVSLADVAAFLAAAGFELPEELRALGFVPTVQEAQAAAPSAAEPSPTAALVGEQGAAPPQPTTPDLAAGNAITAWTPHRRADLLKEFRALEGKRPSEAGKKGKRGALMELVRKTAIDKDTLGDQLDKAIADKSAADMWAQLNTSK